MSTSTRPKIEKSPLLYTGELTCVQHVSDIQRSIKWCQDALGFTLLYHVEEIGWCELATEIEGVTIGLSQVENADIQRGTTLTFSVEDIDAARSKLESKKVRFDGPTQTIPGMVRLATFFDPDGNTFMLSQSLAVPGPRK